MVGNYIRVTDSFVEPDGSWAWKRFADIAAGDVVPLALDQLTYPVAVLVAVRPGVEVLLQGGDEAGGVRPSALRPAALP